MDVFPQPFIPTRTNWGASTLIPSLKKEMKKKKMSVIIMIISG